ncbi:MAG: helix-turn-helix transcriptional regulator [Thermodesulfobacteriota bacterium]
MRQRLTPPTTARLLKLYLKVNGITQQDLARAAGIGAHSINKVVNQSPYRCKSGIRPYVTQHVREAIAQALDLPVEDLWGPDADRRLRRLIQARAATRLFRQMDLPESDPNLPETAEAVNG